MPMYAWKCKKCQESEEVVRVFADYEIPPGGHAEDTPPKEAATCEHDWERVIGGKHIILKSPHWGGKGYW